MAYSVVGGVSTRVPRLGPPTELGGKQAREVCYKRRLMQLPQNQRSPVTAFPHS